VGRLEGLPGRRQFGKRPTGGGPGIGGRLAFAEKGGYQFGKLT